MEASMSNVNSVFLLKGFLTGKMEWSNLISMALV